MWLASLGGRGFHRAEQKIQVGGGERRDRLSFNLLRSPCPLVLQPRFFGGEVFMGNKNPEWQYRWR